MELKASEEELDSLYSLYQSLWISSSALDLSVTLPEIAAATVVPVPVAEASAITTDTADVVADASVQHEIQQQQQCIATTKTNTTAVQVLSDLESVRTRMDALQSVTTKFRKRLTSKDPVTDKPRYGAKTMQRVLTLLDSYERLDEAMRSIFGGSSCDRCDGEGENGGGSGGGISDNENHLRKDDSATTTARTDTTNTTSTILDSLRHGAQQEINAQQRLAQETLERDQRAAQARQAAVEATQRQQAATEQARLDHERQAAEELAQAAAEARAAAARAQADRTAADRAWMEGIPHRKSVHGVRVQLDIFCQVAGGSSSSSNGVTALHTIFSQIVAHPEEPNFRRIRRDHPKFLNDVGQYEGGKELLIAAGFELGFVDDIPSFVCKEPNVEKDLDGWSNWFDLLKGTLEVLEERLIQQA